MARRLYVSLTFLTLLTRAVLEPTTPAAEPRADDVIEDPSEEPPEGYYAFVESPNATPPRVRPPPYRHVSTPCPGSGAGDTAGPHVSANNLCGDLNRGLIPLNPLGQNPNGEPYPFELIRNQTLKFLSRTLPVLRADDTLPRVRHVPATPGHVPATPGHVPATPGHVPATPGHVPTLAPEYAQYVQEQYSHLQGNRLDELERSKRSLSDTPSHSLAREHRGIDDTSDTAGHVPEGHVERHVPERHVSEGHVPRESRKFCDGGGVFCMLYRAINGDSETPAGVGSGAGAGAGVERREDPGAGAAAHPAQHHRYEGPPTPCPARVEYATPVFARNYQGVWRYVVQIPYEGYFTQTVEVTRCMQSRCHYLEGGCLSSPRWLSLLVAELHYPPAATSPAAGTSSPGQDYQQYIQNRAGQTEESSTDKPLHCDGHDELGCFQVRLYYDWFLVPGSCKCWRPDYFARYVRRRQNNEL